MRASDSSREKTGIASSVVLDNRSPSRPPVLDGRPQLHDLPQPHSAPRQHSVRVWAMIARLLLIHVGLLAYAVTQHSPTMERAFVACRGFAVSMADAAGAVDVAFSA